ncbi:sugar phosphate isomerase/epimerase family protein [Mucilaginibacter flavidus]|uniref:sugar phosphate isomerase/epimerase family protein n=1 Tax=Mucilaginibacter flavidus TaxID=2949309 RepID=UPI0020931EC1|nr:sugar phosphate isomerase/epimerase [Mucilaginibacter flavidus]MCO5947758.1 sugar phosphate isomerase/epimerase [Mucilaginibacter flavidus]
MTTNFIKHIKFTAAAFVCLLAVQSGFAQNSTPEKPGVVSYTYRKVFEKDPAAALDMIKANGFTDIEFSSLFGKTAAELKALIDARGIKCSSFGVSYEDLVNKTDEVAQNAKTLGASFVRVAGIPHKAAFTEEEAQKGIDNFNKVGKILKDKYSLALVYHNHGFEFEPFRNGSLFDFLVEQTDPEYVNFEMDVLWTFFPGQDPVEILDKYASRFKLMHLKDLKKGVEGNLSGTTAPENSVTLGTGQINIPAVIKMAKTTGIVHYYLEDESDNVATQVPASLVYLSGLK